MMTSSLLTHKFWHKLALLTLTWIGSSIVMAQTLEEALTLAGSNSDNLSAVLKHYKTQKELEKFKAAVFLIENMSIHESVNYHWVDSTGQQVKYSEFDYADMGAANRVISNMKDSLGLTTENYVKKDLAVITSELLIKNIDLAFHEWKNNPWSSSYSFETFCEYILPYRSLSEPLEDWRKNYQYLVAGAREGLEDGSDPTEVCTNILYSLVGFSFVTRTPDPIPYISPGQILFRREGSCPDLANLALMASRSLGVAVTFDFTPNYAASSNRHFWNTVIDSEGNHIPFNSNAVNNKTDFLPYVYNANLKRVGKVFRRTYAIQTDALAHLLDPEEIPDSFLRHKNLIDVTSEYVRVATITIPSGKIKEGAVAYLNVFNKGRWRVIDWARQTGGKISFQDLGRDIVYLPSVYLQQKMNYYPYPILIQKDGQQRSLKPLLDQKFSAVLSRSNEEPNPFNDFNTLEIEDNQNYLLYYYDKGWQKIGVSKAINRDISFDNLPTNALFLMVPLGSADGFERIFIIDPETYKITWY